MTMMSRSYCLVILLCLLLPLQVWAQDGTITGTVRDAESGRGMNAARVEAIGADGMATRSTLTNAEGRYRLTVAAGTYTVAVAMYGYELTHSEPVTVPAGGTATADIMLRTTAFPLNPIVVTTRRGTPQKATDAPAAVFVRSDEDIRAQPAISVAHHLRGLPGVDIITQGVQSTNVVTRGFNNIFSTSLHTLTDYRLAGVPSLRVNVLHFIPTTNEDLERIEVVLGPGAALYGPNTASGVLHMMTKSPLVHTGTTLSLMGGERDIMQGSMRTAHRLSDRLGVKLSGQLMSGEEWEYIDPDELAERGKFDPSVDPLGFFRMDMMRALDIDGAEADRRIGLIANRDNDIDRWSAEGRVDFDVTPELRAILQAGASGIGSGIELTGLGAAQVKDWRYTYYQARANWNRLFAQVYLNTSDAGDTYLLRTGQPIIDESTLLVGQVQHGLDLLDDRQSFTYGLDYYFTNPQTHGTINGIYEDDDETTEIGGYLQSETRLTSQLDLVLTGRLDDHSALPDVIFSPRAGLVFRPADNQALRATYNRAFSTPNSLNQFLDLPTSVPNQGTDPTAAFAARLGYSVRVQGTGTTGFSFRQPDGSYLMRSPELLGGPPVLIPAVAAPFFPAAVQVLDQLGQFAQNPQLRDYLLGLSPTPADIGTNFLFDGQSFPIAGLNLPDIAPIRETTTTTYELGYQGVLRDRLSLNGAVWFSQIQDFVTPLTVSTPLIALNGPDIAGYLIPRFMQDLGMTQEQATATASALATGMAQVPLGVISSSDVNANGAQLLATYTNVDENLDFWGVDLGAQFLITPEWSLSVSGSLVSDDNFETESVGVVTLNAPKRKGSLALGYRSETNGISAETRVRYNAMYPVKSGVYEGTDCIDTAAGTLPCVDSYTLLDLTFGYTLPQMTGTSLQLSLQNVLNEGYRSFPGVPNAGRLALLRLRYDF